MFLLTTGSRINFEGTRSWLEQEVSEAVLGSIDFVISIDSLGKGDGLFLHVSRPPKDSKAAKIYETFSSTAQSMNIPFEVIHKKIRKSESIVYWEHELFARHKILAATLSHFSEHSLPFERTNIFDDRDNINVDVLRRNIEFLIQVLGKIIYDIEDANVWWLK